MIGSESPPKQSDLDVEVLFEEAHALQRRRWRAWTLASLLIAVLVAISLVASGGIGGGDHPRARSLAGGAAPSRSGGPHANLALSRSSVTLPGNPQYGGITTYDGRVVLTGTNRALGGAQSCVVAAIDSSSLKLTRLPVDCATYPLGETAAVVSSLIANQPCTKYACANTALRIVHRDLASGRSVVGPVVLTYEQVSTSPIQVAYSPGVLWLHSCDTPSGGKLLKISEATGAVEHALSISGPDDLCSPDAVADGSGFYMAADGTSGASGGGPLVVWHVPTSATSIEPIAPQRGWVTRRGPFDRTTALLKATDGSVYVSVDSEYGTGTHFRDSYALWRIDENPTTLHLVTSRLVLANLAGPPIASGPYLYGLESAAPPKPYSPLAFHLFEIVRFDLRTNTELLITTIGDPRLLVDGTTPVYDVVGDSLYVLDQPSVYSFSTRLYRIVLPR